MKTKYTHAVDESGNIRRHEIRNDGEMSSIGQIVVWQKDLGNAESISAALNSTLLVGEHAVQRGMQKLLGLSK